MASKHKFGGSRPEFSISTSVFIRKGKYAKGPSFGLWKAESGPVARGSVKEEYLGDLISFLQKASKNEQSVSFALFKNKPKKDEDDAEDDDEDEDEEDEEEDEDDEDEEEEEKPAKKAATKSSKSSGKSDSKSSKKSKKDWDFDDDDDED
jgi:hypothetical protein